AGTPDDRAYQAGRVLARWRRGRWSSEAVFRFLPCNNPDQGEREREENAEVKKPELEKWHFEVAIILGPTEVPIENRSGVHLIGGKSNETDGWKNGSRNEFEQRRSGRGPGPKQNQKDNAQGDKGVNMKQGHGRVENVFRPYRQQLFLLVRIGSVLDSPLPKKKKTGGNGVKKPALSNKHR